MRRIGWLAVLAWLVASTAGACGATAANFGGTALVSATGWCVEVASR